MVLLSIKKIEKEIINKSITTKQFVIYSFYIVSPIIQLLKTSSYPVNIKAYNFAYALSFVPIIINIIKYMCCYQIIKNENIFIYLYSIIPVSFILKLRYILFLMLPLVIVNFNLIKYFDLDSNYWNAINLQIIGIIVELFIFINFIVVIKRLYKKIYIK